MKAAEFRATANASRAANSQLHFFRTMMDAKTASNSANRTADSTVEKKPAQVIAQSKK